MPARDYTSAPISDQLGIPHIIAGLAADLDSLRAGRIGVNDAVARALLAKQIFNGVRIYLNATKLLSDAARPAQAIDARSDETRSGSAEGESAVPQECAQTPPSTTGNQDNG